VFKLGNVVTATEPSPYPCSRTVNLHDPWTWVGVRCIGSRA